ncbi:MAG: branched-chain amino acid ABC transporter permease, partial [Roseobacter sp.]
MNPVVKNTLLFSIVGLMIIYTGFSQSWNTALVVFNMGLISAIMALGVNLQWGFAGLFNVGIMGFVALGGLAAVLMGVPPTPGAWSAGGWNILAAFIFAIAVIAAVVVIRGKMVPGWPRALVVFALICAGFFGYRALFDPGVVAIEAINPALTGNLGGLGIDRGLWVALAWPVGGLFAAGAAWVIGKTALGLRSDYLAIATLGIAEIIIAVLKNEDWLARGVKNVVGLPRPTPYEIDLQNDPAFVERAAGYGLDAVTASTLYVKLLYAGLFTVVLVILLV